MLYHSKENKSSILGILENALNKVQFQYLEQEYSQISRHLQRPERVFVAELYHQLRTLQDSENGDLNKLHYNVDIPKERLVRNQNHCHPIVPLKRISPDIILHKNQNDKSHLNQLLVCEVKMEGASYKNIEKDLRKLIFYKSKPLQYQNAVFIYTGSENTIKNFLSQFKNNLKSRENFLSCLTEYNIIFAIPKEKKKETNCFEWSLYYVNNKATS